MRTTTKSFLVATAVAAGSLLVTGCGDDDAPDDETDLDDSVDGPVEDDSSDPAPDGDGDDAATSGDGSDVTVTVDGVEYAVTTVQSCATETDTGSETDVEVFGFAETGERIEFTLSYQGADTSPTGTDQYFGRVGVKSGELSASVTADDPFEFLTDDRSTVAGSLQMETTTDPIRTVDVEVDITCP